ncbi:hypothetical protein FGK63_14280 [Ruegeria sediminis]|uniref:Uncharacterized protein n=1 Tax=Ruegeria sediminis TaxID=2583820 RepID=A0ABY2WVK5_9RHOB|nr:hypothetical protein [Ruegeria sediminis]TMV06322.1 hypothetical protein FGK63_14280 [Ruegeria sediminis]
MNTHLANLADRARECRSRGEMAKKYPSEYREIHRRGLTFLFDHMVRKRRKKYTKDELRQIAAKYATRTEFQNNAASAYMAAWRRDILDEIAPASRRGAHLHEARQ